MSALEEYPILMTLYDAYSPIDSNKAFFLF